MPATMVLNVGGLHGSGGHRIGRPGGIVGGNRAVCSLSAIVCRNGHARESGRAILGPLTLVCGGR